MNKLYFGTAGIPGISNGVIPKVKDQTTKGILEVASFDLDALEIEFVRGVYLKLNNKEKLQEIRKTAEEKNILLSIHCPYYINLSSFDPEIIRNSIGYITNSLLVGQEIGSKIALFHPGYFQNQERAIVLEKISLGLEKIISELDKRGNKEKINIGLELTGKETQVGSLEDIFYFYDKYKEERVLPVIDFSHQHARKNGYFKEQKNINSFFEKLNSYPDYVKQMHCHMSGIEYSPKGERNHVMLEDKVNDFPYKKILEKLVESKANGVIISESPIPHKDALLLKKEYEKIK
ncbi:MAG TPA: TIM barrel protein [archaeon]|jgi:deoxyribonuclease-4|nr:TIM barrel protein [archaeon]